MPRLAGIRPKLRPSDILPAMTTSRPSAESADGDDLGRERRDRRRAARAAARAATARSGPARERCDRRRPARGGGPCSTTTSASLASRSSPVSRPVVRKSAPILTAMNENSAMTRMRAPRSARSPCGGRSVARRRCLSAQLEIQAEGAARRHARLGRASCARGAASLFVTLRSGLLDEVGCRRPGRAARA